jgi:hypothetical protein
MRKIVAIRSRFTQIRILNQLHRSTQCAGHVSGFDSQSESPEESAVKFKSLFR